MSKFRFGIRVMVFTIALGLFSVSVTYRVSYYFKEVPVDLPSIESDSPIIVKPQTEKFRMTPGGGGG